MKQIISYYFLFLIFLTLTFFLFTGPLKAYSDNSVNPGNSSLNSNSSGSMGFAASAPASASASASGPGIPAKLFGIAAFDAASYPSSIAADYKFAAGFSLFLGAGFLADRGVNAYFLDHRSAAGASVSNFAYPFGKVYYTAPAAALLSLYGYYSKNTKLLDASFTSLESGLAAGILTEAVKITVGRERPSETDDPFNFHPFNLSNAYNSLPSGDAAISWSMITPYAVYYNQPLLYLIPAAVDFERVYKNRHWVSDTLVGSAIGFSIGYLFSSNHISKNISFISTGNDLLLNVNF